VRYLVRGFLGFGLIAFSWVVLGYAIYQLLQIGTCASGGPYEIARECPNGIERVILMIPAGIVATLVGAWIYSGRGAPPGSDREPRTGLLAVWVWTGIFWSIAAGCFLGVWGPEANPGPGGKLGGLIVGFLFVPMGAGGFFALDLGRGAQRDPQQVRPAVSRIAQTASRFGGAQSVDRLATLDNLRQQGALTDAEFQTLKARILEGK
jgi:hypothetical protein